MVALRFFIITLFFSSLVFAQAADKEAFNQAFDREFNVPTANGYHVSTYNCDGKDYSAVRYVSGDRNDQSWVFVSLCNKSITTQSSYEGEVTSIMFAPPEVRQCADQQQDDSLVDLRRCNDEFINSNGLRGIEGQTLVGSNQSQKESRAQANLIRSENKPTHRLHDRQPRARKANN